MHAYAEARVHFERALELWDPSRRPRRPARPRRPGGALRRRPGARRRRCCREAIALTDEPARKALLYERLGEFHFWDDEAALECYDRALELLPGEPRLLAAAGHALMGLRRWDEARACCEAALAAGAGPRITLGLVLAFLGEPEAGEAHLRRALELAETGEETARAYLHLGELLRVRGDHAGALAAMVDGEREAARLGLRGSFGHFMYVNAADDLLRLGRWDEAAERLAEAARMDLSRTAGGAAARDVGQLARRCAATSKRRGASSTPRPTTGCPSEFLAPLARRARGARARRGRRRAPRACTSTVRSAGVEDPFYTPPLYSLGAARGGRRRRAGAGAPPRRRSRRAPARCSRRSTRSRRSVVPPDALAAPARWRGPSASRRRRDAPRPQAGRGGGRVRRAGGALPGRLRAAARGRGDAAGRRRARRGAARARGRARHRERARRSPAARGGGGARPARAARTSARLPPRRRSDDDGVGPHDARDRGRCRLLADGLTNREIAGRLFISQKTVAAHMAHIYGKLGVHSRVEAAGRAQQLGVLERPS